MEGQEKPPLLRECEAGGGGVLHYILCYVGRSNRIKVSETSHGPQTR